jgi:hypothetical protein
MNNHYFSYLYLQAVVDIRMHPLHSIPAPTSWTNWTQYRSMNHDVERDDVELHEKDKRPPLVYPDQSNFDANRVLLSIAFPLLPSFAHSAVHRVPRKLYPTSYLDGLRGVAALIVVIHHYAYEFTSISPEGWHTGEPGTHDYIFLMPIVRAIHSGRFMVVIFFVISGYVLSYRGLQLAREGKTTQLFESLSSSVFRRWIRLHLPVIASTLVGFFLARWGAWVNLTPDWNHTGGSREQRWYPHAEGTFMEQLSGALSYSWLLLIQLIVCRLVLGYTSVNRPVSIWRFCSVKLQY